MDGSEQTPVFRRLFGYAMLFKYRIAAALLVLCCAVGAELAGPFIAKTIIDRHIGSIQLPWYETAAPISGSIRQVELEGRSYVREDWLEAATLDQGMWKEARILQLERGLYLVRDVPSAQGSWTLMAGGGDSGAQVKLTKESGELKLFPARKLSAAEAASFYQHDIMPVIRWLLLFVGLLALGSILHYIQGYTLQVTALRIIQRMRMDLMRHIQNIPIRYFDNTPIGQVVSRIANDTEAIRDLFMSFMATFVVSMISIIGIYIALFLLDTRLALVTLLFMPLFTAVMLVHLKFSKKYISIMRARLSDMNAMISESIAVMPILQAFRQEANRLREFDELNEDRYRNNIKQHRVFSLSSRNFTGLVGSLFTAGAIWYFGGQSLHTSISFGVFYAFIDYTGRFFQPIIGIFDQLLNAQRAVVSAEKVFALMDIEGKQVEKADEVPRPQGNVVFDHVSFAYHEGEPVLRGISFEARKGETIALVGHTGSGKSSIMNLLLGFYEPTAGEIRIDGSDITSMSKQTLRKHMGIVLQDPFLFAGDIKFNVSLYNENIGPEQVRKALADVGASIFVEQLPGGYNETVVERGSTLSSGQRQLISFARALAFDPAILILDEATASIDSETEGLIQEALRIVSAGRTTFVIAHRLSTIRDADQILVLHRGEIVERGTHEQLMQREGRYYRMYQLQSGGTAPPTTA
ncbi:MULTISPECIES: ABC transporter ATP-binding protein [unclassified Paenibacillus]|uniref:ABC transporter ATP-binding protein n=1 Tax=unclassified Paenibacillus TaxID=185978 RepID=UPI001AEB491B|nr:MULTISPECIES: ABC transporter ATP-binding protein [unclassified Paenibacillus]MBP1157582.1 ATP-binding cassette subfamily B protein [Paenibacillus sp. PvP091]MBP1171681.1 ATP-binding cassette subfamily B protein [Paenibacillus sp. PvR098]MBP2438062.1 ATP-binding cassette subfamily B protein [Paenibacillus sp. PvP052]